MTTTTTTPKPIQVPFQLYTLHAVPGWAGSPSEPAVDLLEQDLDGKWLAGHNLKPAQARELAAQLVKAADAAEGGVR
jgi:hypothetical protein